MGPVQGPGLWKGQIFRTLVWITGTKRGSVTLVLRWELMTNPSRTKKKQVVQEIFFERSRKSEISLCSMVVICKAPFKRLVKTNNSWKQTTCENKRPVKTNDPGLSRARESQNFFFAGYMEANSSQSVHKLKTFIM